MRDNKNIIPVFKGTKLTHETFKCNPAQYFCDMVFGANFKFYRYSEMMQLRVFIR